MQPSLPSTSKAAFMTEPAIGGQPQSDGGPSTASGSSEVTGTKKTKASGNETSLLERLLMRLQDNRLQSGDPETARKLQEINRSQNASNIILKKILNIAFVTTGVALLLSVIFVIIYTSIVKHGSKDDERSSVEMAASNGDLNAFLHEIKQLKSSDAVQKGHVHSQEPLSRDTVIVSSDGGKEDGEVGYPRVDESSPSSSDDRRRGYPANPNSRGAVDSSVGTDGGWGVVTRCRAVPMVNEGELKMGQMCYQSKDDESTPIVET